MDMHMLEDIGLTNVQARAYRALIEHGNTSAPAIAAFIGESRTNAYKVLDKLCELGLVTKDLHGKRIRYFPTSPIALEQFVQQQAAAVNLRERKLKAAMPSMLDFFFAHSEQPGIRFYQGEDGLREMFYDQARGKGPVYFIRSHEGIRHFGNKEAHRLRNLFPARGIVRYGIVQDIEPPDAKPDDRMPVAESDKLMMLNRTWITSEDYDEPVEWVAYGDKLAIISFGKEIIGMVIESPQIAEAFRKLYKLLDSTVRQRPGYKDLPKKALYTRTPMSVKLQRNLKKTRSKPTIRGFAGLGPGL
jgi:sugar-specific transcriptional regulator TrmB